MMRSMFSGVSGLRVHQTRMDVIANNIANVNTVGFKSSRVTFSEIFSQTVAGASAPNAELRRGGTNPMQIGLGANVASIDLQMTTGAAQRTDNPFDVMIQGDGFLIVGDASGTFFTRAGALDVDRDGNIHMNGFLVMGWDAVPSTTRPGQFDIERGTVQPLSIGGAKQSIRGSATQNMEVSGNLNAATTPNRVGTMEIFDSIGNRYVIDVRYSFDADSGAWTKTVGPYAYLNGNRDQALSLVRTVGAGGAITLTIGASAPTPGDIDWDTLTPIAQMHFDTNGTLIHAGAYTSPLALPAAGARTTNFDIIMAAADPNHLLPNSTFGGANGTVNLDFVTLTQMNDQATVRAIRLNGNRPGTLVGMSIGTDGIIMGRYSNDEMRPLGQIPIARFANPGGLEKVGNNLFIATSNSGDFDGIGEDIAAAGGRMMGGVLEMSNVDLSNEFTEMITTQRGFQANSRIITTSDDMLQELVNLRR